MFFRTLMTCTLLAASLANMPAHAADTASGLVYEKPEKPDMTITVGPFKVRVYRLFIGEMDWLYAVKSDETGDFSAVADNLTDALDEYINIVYPLVGSVGEEQAEFLDSLQDVTKVTGKITAVRAVNNTPKLAGTNEEEITYFLKLNSMGDREFEVVDFMLPNVGESEEYDPKHLKADVVGKVAEITMVGTSGKDNVGLVTALSYPE